MSARGLVDRARRRMLSFTALTALWPLIGRAQQPDDLARLIRELTGASAPRSGRVKLDIPRLADNGNAVPLKVVAASPMTTREHVKTIHLVAEKNPRPLIATFHLGPRAGRAEVDTRIRLNGTQRVAAIATMSDGSQWMDVAEVDVTESACYDATNP